MMAVKNREHILDELPDDGVMLEWGSGDNTLWFLDQLKPTQHLFSIEHNRSWFDRIDYLVKDHPKRKQHSYMLCEDRYPLGYYPDPTAVTQEDIHNVSTFSTPYEELTAGLADYIYPKDHIVFNNIDLFLVDGIARGACLTIIHITAKESATVFLHDVRDRDWYDWAIRLYKYTEYTTPNLMMLRKNKK